MVKMMSSTSNGWKNAKKKKNRICFWDKKRIPKDMGMVWEAYHKGVPLLGVPEISLDGFYRSANQWLTVGLGPGGLGPK